MIGDDTKTKYNYLFTNEKNNDIINNEVMNMEHLLKIFNDLKNHSGRNDKEKILEKNKDNQLFREVLRFVYNPYIVTGISTKKMKKKVKVSVNHNLSSINEVMDYLAST